MAVGRPGEDRDGEIGIALGDECELRSRAQSDIDRIRAEPLLQLRAAVEINFLDIDAMCFEETLLQADIERHEIERPGHGLANAQLVIGTCVRRREQCGEQHSQNELHTSKLMPVPSPIIMIVVPAKAGTQDRKLAVSLDPRLRGGNEGFF